MFAPVLLSAGVVVGLTRPYGSGRELAHFLSAATRSAAAVEALRAARAAGRAPAAKPSRTAGTPSPRSCTPRTAGAFGRGAGKTGLCGVEGCTRGRRWAP